jgi:hypothetical protein
MVAQGKGGRYKTTKPAVRGDVAEDDKSCGARGEKDVKTTTIQRKAMRLQTARGRCVATKLQREIDVRQRSRSARKDVRGMELLRGGGRETTKSCDVSRGEGFERT